MEGGAPFQEEYIGYIVSIGHINYSASVVLHNQSNVQRRDDLMKNSKASFKFIVYSIIGIFMFFIPVTWRGSSSIPVDHIVTFIRSDFPVLAIWYGLIVTTIGGIWPWVKGTWKKSKFDMIFSIFKLAGIVVAYMIYFKAAPAWMMDPDMGPFLLNKLVVPVGILVPIGSVFLSFLISYGLMEFVGAFVRPVMRAIWKTPGRSAIDAVASFVGSYSVALIITNRVYKEGKYTKKEAAIIATGFSTVSATFMIVVAKTLQIMDMWNLFFWSTLVITFIVTAITARIWPLANMPDEYEGTPDPEKEIKGNLLSAGWEEAVAAADSAPGLMSNILSNLKDGFKMAMAILPTIMSIGMLGLALAEFTPIFDIIGYIFYPFTWIVRVPDPMLAAKASAVEIAEMFLPAALVAGTATAALATKFVVAVVSISAILFFSASIPCIVSTDIPVSLPQILIIWVERTILSILLAGVLCLFIF